MELDELYKEVILTHASHPRNFGTITNPDGTAHGANPLCGDTYDIDVKLSNGTIEDVKFHGSGCSISKASASIMTEVIKGKSVEDAISIMHDFEELLHGKFNGNATRRLGELLALKGVSAFPARVKCAILPWKTFREAIENAVGK